MKWLIGILAGLSLAAGLVGLSEGTSSASAQYRETMRMTATPQAVPRRAPGTVSLTPASKASVGTVVDTRSGALPTSGSVEVMVELSAPPVARVYALAHTTLRLPDSVTEALTRAQLERIEADQQALIPILTGPPINATVISRTQQVMNGIMLTVDVTQLDTIQQLPGVLSVRWLQTGELTGSQAPTLPGKPDVQPAPNTPGRSNDPSIQAAAPSTQ